MDLKDRRIDNLLDPIRNSFRVRLTRHRFMWTWLATSDGSGRNNIKLSLVAVDLESHAF